MCRAPGTVAGDRPDPIAARCVLARSGHPPGASYVVVHLLNIDTGNLQRLRDQYDPTARVIAPHVTLVFPFGADTVAEPDLFEHVARVAQTSAPFEAHFSRLEMSWDQWVFLTPDRGGGALVRLHDHLYDGLLQPFHRVDLPFVPHVSLGYFGSRNGGPAFAAPESSDLDHARHQRFLSQADQASLECRIRVTEIELLSVNADFTGTQLIRSFPLGG